jgi:tRNA nucleotidyltransferase (CCA-adding enzyme)
MCARSVHNPRSAIVQNERMSAGAPEVVLEQLRYLPGGEALLDVAAGRGDVELVGGAVRDLLLGRTPRELDVVADDALPLAQELAASSIGALAGENPDESFESTFHERFRTARVWWKAGRIDIATRRSESYSADGALPDVAKGSPENDLARRDFTVNAIAVPLGGPNRGKLRAVRHALDDLAQRRLRALHVRSFLEDPTRLLRLARYKARLGFEVEPGTAALAREAITMGALGTVSGARIGAELRLALVEDDAVASLVAMDDLGLLGALHPRLRFEERAARATLVLLPEDGRSDLALLASLLLPLALRAGDDPRTEIMALLDRWDFPGADRDRVAAATVAVPRLIEELPAAERPSLLRAIAANVPLEGVALAGALGAQESASRWLENTRQIHLDITGDDLLMAGVPEGPEIGRRLEAVLELRLDGRLPDGREAELQAALGLPMPEENGAGGLA